MGRLEDIVERNRNPRRGRKLGMTMGIGMALFVFIILVLLVFTDLGDSPQASQQPTPPAPAADTGEKRVRGIGLYRERPRAVPPDAGP